MNDKVKNVSPDADTEEAAALEAKLDLSSNYRIWEGLPKFVVRWLCVAFSLFMLAINTFIFLPPQVHRSAFVGIILVLAFMLYPAKSHRNKINYVPWFDVLLAVAGAASFLYYSFNFRTIVGQLATFTTMDLAVALLGMAVLFIACYRVVGLPLVIVVAGFISYTFFGSFIPGSLGHAGFRFERVFTYLFYTTEGIIGIPISVASTFIFVFMLFGAFLDKTGIGQFFIDISNAIAGKATGGPAKAAVIVSALGGMVSGSSVANTVSSGFFTIPMMKRMGYDKNFAGAVEASASTGGQIVPPILGAAAFLMAEITGIPYSQIALAALIPAVLYFVGVFASVHFEAKRQRLKGLPENEIPKVLPLLLQKGQLCFGIVSIVVFLAMGYTPTRAAMFAILVSIAVSMIRKETRLTPEKFVDALENGTRNSIGVAVACAMAGMIVGVVTMTGLGFTFTSAIIGLPAIIANEAFRLLVVLVMCMVASIIIGLGMPTTAKYVIMATVTAPILVQMGVPLLAAHMFVFYFGIVADITPPVGLAAYAGSAIAKGDPMTTSLISCRLAVAAFIVPFIFAYNPTMLFIDASVFDIISITITSIIGIILVASGLSGYLVSRMTSFERFFAISAGLALVLPGMVTDIIGVGALITLVFIQKRRGTDPAFG